MTKFIIYFNNCSIVKGLFLKHGSERFKPSLLQLKWVCKVSRWAKFLTNVKDTKIHKNKG